MSRSKRAQGTQPERGIWDVARLALKMAVSASGNVWSGLFIVVLIFLEIPTRVFIGLSDFRE